MTIRELVSYRLTLFLSLITISIIAVDRPLAIFIEKRLAFLQPAFHKILSWIEFVSESVVAGYIIAGIILLAALVLLIKDRSIDRAKIFFFIGATLVSTRLVIRLLKYIFGRNRPHAFIDDHSIGDFFCKGSDSFPSGHAGNYFGFFLPLMFLFPRYKEILLILPVFVALQRIIVNDHYLSDVLAGIMTASLVALLFQRVFKVQPLQNPKTAN